MADEERRTRNETPNRSSSTTVELTKALVWPFIVVFLLVAFWKPLHILADYVPQLLSNTEEFSISGVRFQLRKSLVDQASPDVKQILGDLGVEDIRLILDTPPQNMICWPTRPSQAEKQVQPYSSLLNLGLFREMTKEEKRQQESQHIACEYGVTPTPKFGPIRDFMIKGIVEAIQQAQALPVSKPGAKTR